jgi:putative sterol carrier protein
MADQANGIAASFAQLQLAFQPQNASGVNRTIQFDFSGREASTWNLHVYNGTMEYAQGPATNPNATITVDSDDWLKVLSGELNPVNAFMGGKLKVSPASAAMDLMQFQNWFAR